MLTKIGIIGMGFVGGAVARGFALYADVKFYDNQPERSGNSLEDTCQSDFVFLCLPTPMTDKLGGAADLSILKSVCKTLKEKDLTHPIYILKSTCPIGTTKALAEEFGLKIIHSPEFLTARNANIDFITPSRIVLGGEHCLCEKARPLFENRFPGVNIITMSSDESEAVKYICNAFFAIKVLFFNEAYLGLKGYNLDWEAVMAGVLSDGRIGISHYQVPGHDGKFGYGGTCLLPSAKVALEDGNILSLQQLYELKNQSVAIESTNAECSNIEYKMIKEVTRRDVNEELYVFKTSQGNITCTGDHYFPIYRDEKLIIEQAKNIKESDQFFSK